MNPLLSDRFVDLVLFAVADVEGLCRLPAFSEHSRATIEPWLEANRRLARGALFATYRAMHEAPPRFANGRVETHAAMKSLWPRMVELGVLSAMRPLKAGGQQLLLPARRASHSSRCPSCATTAWGR